MLRCRPPRGGGTWAVGYARPSARGWPGRRWSSGSGWVAPASRSTLACRLPAAAILYEVYDKLGFNEPVEAAEETAEEPGVSRVEPGNDGQRLDEPAGQAF
jgi:hypothetical protein